MDIVEVSDRATALALERQVLDRYHSAAPVSLHPDLLPGGGTTECWAAHAGHLDLGEEVSRLRP